MREKINAASSSCAERRRLRGAGRHAGQFARLSDRRCPILGRTPLSVKVLKAMGKGRPPQQLQQLYRRERGTPVQLRSRTIKLPDGSSVTEHGLDLANLDIPERVYEADAIAAFYEKGMVRVLFAQAKLGGGLRSLVIVSMAPIATLQLLHLVDSLKSPTIDEIAKTVSVTPEPLMGRPEVEPDQTAMLRASLAAVAVAGTDACFDFYYSNAFSLANVKNSEKLHIEPVVRINTYTGLCLSLITTLRGFVVDFPASVRMTQEVEHE